MVRGRLVTIVTMGLIILLFLRSNVLASQSHLEWDPGSYIEYSVKYTEIYNRDITSSGVQVYPEDEYPNINIMNEKLTLNYTGVFNVISNK
jgi:hypothetical protein